MGLYQPFLLYPISEVLTYEGGHILDNNIADIYRSPYKAVHSCETSYVKTIGKRNGYFCLVFYLCVVLTSV